MLLKGKSLIKEAQIAPHYFRPQNFLPHVRTHGEGDRRRMATLLAREVEKLSLGVLHREPKVLESVKHNPIRLREAWDVPIKGAGLAQNSAIIHIRQEVTRQV
jgi:hypothetical protein